MKKIKIHDKKHTKLVLCVLCTRFDDELLQKNHSENCVLNLLLFFQDESIDAKRRHVKYLVPFQQIQFYKSIKADAKNMPQFHWK